MPITTTTTAAAAAGIIAGKKAIEKVVTDLYDGASSAIKTKLKKWKNKQTLDDLYTRIANVRNVKTIWQTDHEVDLHEFYHPVKVEFDHGKRKVTKIKDFKYKGNLLIEGIVGQGKSIFLRYLCSQEILDAMRIPVFLELRRIEKGSNLVSTLIEKMTDLGFEIGKQEFNYLAKQGKIVIFLDAFDEVSEDLQTPLVSQIESLSEKYPNLQIIVTSRPDNRIIHSPHFRVFRIAPINSREIAPIIFKLTDENIVGVNLVQALKDDPGGIKGVLTTPLMITLLVITYRAYEILPSKLSDFYDELFSILISRHDQTKPGYARDKECGLCDSYIRDVFDVFCFLTRKDHASQITEREVLKYAKKALKLESRNCDEAAYIHDIRKITNLLLKEGNKYYFIHKSVQEFHSAFYVSNLKDDSQAKSFYDSVRGNWRQWNEELHFLAEIDTFKWPCRTIPSKQA